MMAGVVLFFLFDKDVLNLGLLQTDFLGLDPDLSFLQLVFLSLLTLFSLVMLVLLDFALGQTPPFLFFFIVVECSVFLDWDSTCCYHLKDFLVRFFVEWAWLGKMLPYMD